MGINRKEKNDEKIVILITKSLKEQIYKETIRTGLSRGALIRNWIEKELKENAEDENNYFAEHQKERVKKMASDPEGGAISFKDACEAVRFWFTVFWYMRNTIGDEEFEKWYMFCVHELNRCRYTLTVEELREYQELVEKWRNEKNDAKKV